jgi:ComF family protein
MLDAVLDVLYPRKCVGCGAPRWPFCARCWTDVAALSPPGCERCGRPLETAVSTCRDCPPGALRWSRSSFLYAGPARHVLMRLKFSGMRSIAEALAPWMLQAVARSPPRGWPMGLRGDSSQAVLTWVPLGRRRKRERGYDQAEVLCRALHRLTGWRLQRLLRRVTETPPQAMRSARDRKLALRGAFRSVAAPPYKVVLVDDVLTTGATAAECAAELLRAGAGEVGVLTAARSLGGPLPAHCYTPAGLQPGSVVAREMFSR